jgi:hypothetical protein
MSDDTDVVVIELFPAPEPDLLAFRKRIMECAAILDEC